ncbi:autotransporter assembly complex protein TamA [Thalassotalea ganghwensis]
MTLLCCLLFFQSMSSARETSGTRLEIIGVENVIKENILAHLNVEKDKLPPSALGFVRTDAYIERHIKQALQALGYYQPVINLAGDHAHKKITIDIGPALLWQRITIDYLCSAEEKAIVELAAPFTINQVINHGQYTNFKNKLLINAQENGFLNAKFVVSELNVNVEQAKAELNWQLDCGPRYQIGTINILNTELSSSLLQKYVLVSSGDYYQQEKLIESQQNLNRAGFLKSVFVRQDIDHLQKRVDISFIGTDNDKYELKSILGYGTDTGAKLGASWLNRRVNDRAHSYLINLELGRVDLNQPDLNVAFQYRVPLSNAMSQWNTTTSFQRKNEKIGQTETFTVESSLVNQKDRFWSSQWRLTLAQETLTSDADVENRLHYLFPSWQVNYYSVAEPFRAIEGWRWQSLFRIGSKYLSSPDVDFIQTDQRLKKIWSLDDRWRLLWRTRVGATWMDTNDFNFAMPTDYRFFAGGDVSVRGYDYQSLSPEQDGYRVGGKHLLASSLEVDYLFSDEYRLALFTDQGNAFNRWQDWQLKKSVGLGFRWVTVIGSIRLDIAKALDDDRQWQAHITIGPDL